MVFHQIPVCQLTAQTSINQMQSPRLAATMQASVKQTTALMPVSGHNDQTSPLLNVCGVLCLADNARVMKLIHEKAAEKSQVEN